MAKKDVQQGTLALMVLKTLDVLGALHGYGIARRIEQISGDLLAVNQGTLYPVLLKLEQEGAISSEWGTSENNRTGTLLSPHSRRAQTAPGRNQGLGTDHRNDRAVFRGEAGGLAMKALRRFFVRLTASIARGRDERRLREEIEEHLALQTAENIQAGMSPYEARRQAVLKFGAVEAIKADYRDRQGLPFLDHLVTDVRHALRSLRTSPGFTAVAVITLALGIGANTAIFSLIDGLLFKKLPVENPHELVVLRPEDAQLSRRRSAYPTWERSAGKVIPRLSRGSSLTHIAV